MTHCQNGCWQYRTKIKDYLCAAHGNPALQRKIIRRAIDAAYLDVLGPVVLRRMEDARA